MLKSLYLPEPDLELPSQSGPHTIFFQYFDPGDFSTTLVYILHSFKHLYPPSCSQIVNPDHFKYRSGADRVN